MTGFEKYILEGIRRGVSFIVDEVVQVVNDNPDLIDVDTPGPDDYVDGFSISDPSKVRLVELTARRVMNRWPAWKQEWSRQVEMPYPLSEVDRTPGDFITCDGCESVCARSNLKSTPRGYLCAHCLQTYLDEYRQPERG